MFRTIACCATILVHLAPAAYGQTFTRVLDVDNPVVNDMAESGGACWIDLNDDDLLDLFVANGNLTNQNDNMYRNTGTGFVKVLAGPVVNDGGPSIGGTFGDYDNDGAPDLFVTNRNNFGNFLYHGEGDTLFTEITTGRAGYGHRQLEQLVVDRHRRRRAPRPLRGELRRDRFPLSKQRPAQRSASPGSTPRRLSSAPRLRFPGAWGDYDNDRDQDLFIGIAGTGNDRLYRNEGGFNFTLVQFSDARATLGASWGDYDNDGDLDLFTSIFLNQGNILYRNAGAPGIALDAGGHESCFRRTPANSVGSGWGDYDNDGDQDLFVANDGENNMLFENGGPPAYAFTRITTGAP